MISCRILSRHVMKTTGLAMLGAVVVLLFLQLLFSYLAELGNLKPHYNAWQALIYVLWDAPRKLLQLLPISALMGAVIGLGTLASNSELVVMRAAGVSLWRIVGWVIRPALLLVVLSFALSQWVIPYSNDRAEMVKKSAYTAELGEVRGYWSKEGQRFIYVDYANSQGQLQDIQLIDFDKNYRITQTTNAQSGQFKSEKQWQLQQLTQVHILSDGQAQQQRQTEQMIPLALQPQFVHMITVDPEDLSPSQLVSFMRYMQQYSQVPKKYQLAFWQKIAEPLSLIALVVVACSFVFGPLRQQSMGFRVVIALFVGLGFYYLEDFFGYASLIYSPSPAWFIFTPIVLLFAAGGYLLYRVR